MRDKLLIIAYFVWTRWFLRFRARAALDAHQSRRVTNFLRRLRALFPRLALRPTMCLEDFQVIDKKDFLHNFAAYNTLGLELDAAQGFALIAEKNQQFQPELRGLTIGLSSGTSGRRGVFMATHRERAMWAGILLARMLRRNHLLHLLNPFKLPLQIAFFLRSDGNLYQTLGSRRIGFVYYSLLDGLAVNLGRLRAQQPHVLVAPASLLVALAREKSAGRLPIAPQQVISVAEVLDPDDERAIAKAFGVGVDQIYQATEGFLGYTCAQGRLHLNEAFVHIEKEWLDSEHMRFVPIITDFSRETQAIVRYRLDDILHVSREPCSCGCCEQVIERIEGRIDDILRLKATSGATIDVYPDLVRRMLFAVDATIDDFRITQTEQGLSIRLKAENIVNAETEIRQAFAALWDRLNVEPPPLSFAAFAMEDKGSKRRRIVCTLGDSGRHP